MMILLMRRLVAFFTISVSAFLSSCAINNKLVFDPVGPPWYQPVLMNPTLTNGTLVVYSACRRNANFNALNPYSPVYSDYKILTPDGKLLQKVHNDSGTMLQDAVPVELPAGAYWVFARANGYGLVTIPIIIKAQQNTVLHLEGGGFWPNESVFNQTNAVRLPDGLIIGWKVAPDL